MAFIVPRAGSTSHEVLASGRERPPHREIAKGFRKDRLVLENIQERRFGPCGYATQKPLLSRVPAVLWSEPV